MTELGGTPAKLAGVVWLRILKLAAVADLAARSTHGAALASLLRISLTRNGVLFLIRFYSLLHQHIRITKDELNHYCKE